MSTPTTPPSFILTQQSNTANSYIFFIVIFFCTTFSKVCILRKLTDDGKKIWLGLKTIFDREKTFCHCTILLLGTDLWIFSTSCMKSDRLVTWCDETLLPTVITLTIHFTEDTYFWFCSSIAYQ